MSRTSDPISDLIDAWNADAPGAAAAYATALRDPETLAAIVRELHFRRALGITVVAREQRRAETTRSSRLPLRRVRRRTQRSHWFALAASVVLIIGVLSFGILSNVMGTQHSASPAQADPATVAPMSPVAIGSEGARLEELSGIATITQAGQEHAGREHAARVHDLLPPNTTLTVVGEARLRTPETSSTLSLRNATIRGQADGWHLTAGTCEVAAGHQPVEHPLRFVTPAATAEVVGTHFCLIVSAGGTALTVSEGTVRFIPTSGPVELVAAGGHANATLQVMPPAVLSYHFAGATGWPVVDVGSAGCQLPLQPTGDVLLQAAGVHLQPGATVTSVGLGDPLAAYQAIQAAQAMSLKLVVRWDAVAGEKVPGEFPILLGEIMGFTTADQSTAGTFPLQLWRPVSVPIRGEVWQTWVTVLAHGSQQTWMDATRVAEVNLKWTWADWHGPLQVKLGSSEQVSPADANASRMTIASCTVYAGALTPEQIAVHAAAQITP